MTAGWLDDVRGAPAVDGLAQVAEAIAPGSRVAGVRRLGGGLGAAMHRFDLLLPGGKRQRLVLRRYPRAALAEDPEQPVRAWRTLHALEQLGVSAPRPVWRDLNGRIFGTSAYVMTLLAGHSDLRPRDRDHWLRQLGAALAGLHRTRIAGVDLGFLRGANASLERRFEWAMRDEMLSHPQGSAVQQALARWQPRLRRMTPVLSHGDYWAGNTLWLRDRVTAIVDWDAALIAPPGFDVGYCRVDLVMEVGVEAADTFLHAYEAAAGMRIPQLFIWDLLGASVALPDPERWLPGLHDLGRRDLTPQVVRERLALFIADALARAGA